MAVISIWLPGSPFDLYNYFRQFSFSNWWKNTAQPFSGANNTIGIPSHIDWNHFETNGRSLDSIFAFLSGISGARFGLWMTDLSIIHIMQEGVSEAERNTVFGAHNALCQIFSVLKDVLVFVLPDPSTFGLCILISYGFVTSGYAAYVYYIVKHPIDIPNRLTLKKDSTKRNNQDDSEGGNSKFVMKNYEISAVAIHMSITLY
uniref:Solute carrier family 40 member n=1 Tax=Heterorhabditis bacteriophora TaxID=37862 RepID=A0A1I7WJ18_HETBA